jgi:polyhydroxyalkanoate synthase
MAVRPENVTVPSFVVIPAQDRIVPPASALALATALPGAVLHQPPLGHIGMVVGGQATAELWQPLARWLDLPSNQRL